MHAMRTSFSRAQMRLDSPFRVRACCAGRVDFCAASIAAEIHGRPEHGRQQGGHAVADMATYAHDAESVS